LSNPAKVAHEQEYEEWCWERDSLEEMFESLRRHFGDHKEGRAHEWATFRREPRGELPALHFRPRNLARDLGKDKGDQELVTKFVTSLDRRLTKVTSAQVMAVTEKPAAAYTLEEAYKAALQVQAVRARLRIARELAPRQMEAGRLRARVTEVRRPEGGRRSTAAQAVSPASWHPGHVVRLADGSWLAASSPVAGGGSGSCHNCGETGHYKNGCPYPRRNSSGVNRQHGWGSAGALGACFVCGQPGHQAAQCFKRVSPPEMAAGAAAPRVGDDEAVDTKEFRAFQEWRSAVQATEDGEGWGQGGCALGAIALPTWASDRGCVPAAIRAPAETRRAGVKGGSERGQRREPEGKCPVSPHVTSAAHGAPMGVP
jgi:hypothetical protein